MVNSLRKIKNSIPLSVPFQLYRQPRGLIWRQVEDGDWEAVADFSDQQSSWEDRNAPKGKKVSYYIVVEMGNGRFSSPSNVVECRM